MGNVTHIATLGDSEKIGGGPVSGPTSGESLTNCFTPSEQQLALLAAGRR